MRDDVWIHRMLTRPQKFPSPIFQLVDSLLTAAELPAPEATQSVVRLFPEVLKIVSGRTGSNVSFDYFEKLEKIWEDKISFDLWELTKFSAVPCTSKFFLIPMLPIDLMCLRKSNPHEEWNRIFYLGR